MTLRLNGSNSGFTEVKAPATAGSNTITLPTSNGSANQFLMNSGTAGELEFASLASSDMPTGSILQVVSTHKRDTSTFTSLNGAYSSTVPGLTVAITPSSTSNKILVTGIVCFSTSGTAQNGVGVTMLRGSTEIFIANAGNSNTRSSFAGYYSPDDNRLPQAIPFEFLDAPNTTSETTYGLKLFQPFSATISVHVNLNGDGTASGTRVRTTSVITAMEVAA